MIKPRYRYPTLFFVVLIFLASISGIVAAAPDQNGQGQKGEPKISKAPVNVAFVDAKARGFPDAKGTTENHGLGSIPSPVDKTHLKGKKVTQELLLASGSPEEGGSGGDIVGFPATYHLTTYGRVPISRTPEVQGISLLAQHRNPPQRQYFPLFSWMSPLIGEVRSRPLSMRVLDAETGKEYQFRPIDNFWKISMEGDGTKRLSDESMDLAGQIFSFWRGKTSGSNQ